MGELLTKDQLADVIKNQLIYEKNIEVRPVKEIVKEFPFRAAKSIGITSTLGAAGTFGASFYAFRQVNTAINDTKIAFPLIGSFSLIDFGLNYSMTKLTGKVVPEHWISTLSSSAAGATCGYIFGHHQIRPTIAGGVAGLIYGYMRNAPLQMLGIEPF